MNPGDPLAELAPLREPELIGWWPPAPGWWILAVLITALLAYGLYRLWRHYRRNAYRRQALRQLDALRGQVQEPGEFVTGLNALLKSTALAAYPQRDIAAIHGMRWCSFLNDSLQPGEQFDETLATAGYAPSPAGIDRERLAHSAERWIRRHKGPGR